MSELDVSTTLFDWFHDRVQSAHKEVGTELSSDSELYLTALLVERARADRPEATETTLVELHARAAAGTPSEQVKHWRELGDRSLYTVGYFEESLSRRVVNASYYRDMGALAYSRVDAVFRRWFANAFGGVFQELAGNFEDCTKIVRRVRESADQEPDLLLRWYREWLATGSEVLAERLRAQGMILPPRIENA